MERNPVPMIIATVESRQVPLFPSISILHHQGAGKRVVSCLDPCAFAVQTQ